MKQLVPKGTAVWWCCSHRKFFLAWHKAHPVVMQSVTQYDVWLEVAA